MNEETKTTFDSSENENKKTILEEMVSTYVGKVREINKQHELGVEVENQTKIGDMISDGKRNKEESFFDYKLRRKAEQLIVKHYKKGVRGR